MNIKILPERVKEERKRLNLSQQDLAKKIGYKKQAIWRWEHSEIDVYIRENKLNGLASALLCTPDYLTGASSARDKMNKDGKESKAIGISLNLQNDIRERIRYFSAEQLIFLQDFLKIIELSEPAHLLLFKKMFSAALEISSLTFSHPLNNWNLFKNSFVNTSNSLKKFESELKKCLPQNDLPKDFANALEACFKSIQNDFQSLSKPLHDPSTFKCLLKHTNESLNSYSQF